MEVKEWAHPLDPQDRKVVEVFLPHLSSKKGPRRKAVKYRLTDKGCWECISHYKDKDGYPMIKVYCKQRPIGKIMWEVKKERSFSKGKVMTHSCDNPSCINPSHITPKFAFENDQERVDKDRQAKGETHGMSVLKTSEVRAIKKMLKSNFVVSWLANIYNVSESTIYRIKNKKTWRYI